jgi:hypothetical protein
MPVELVVGAAVGAAVASPGIRKTLRKGLVYGLAGALIAYDNVAALAVKARNLRKGKAADAAPVASGAQTTPGSSDQPAAAEHSATPAGAS